MSIDTGEARALPGVRAVLTADELPGQVKVGHLKRDQWVLVPVGEEVHFCGDPIVLIAADTPEVSGSFVPSWRMKTVFTKTSSGIPKKYSPGSQFIVTSAPVPRSTVTVRSLTGALSEPSETTSDLSIR